MPRTYDYCPRCAAAFTRREIHGYERMVCPVCRFIFWQNPAVGVAVIVMRGDRIVLARRARGVYRGDWCIPCGYVEYDEEVRQAAYREFLEETSLRVEIGEVYAVHSNFHDPASHSVGIWFMGSVLDGALRAADDVDEVAWVPLNEVPGNMAFPTDRLVIERLRREHGAAGA